MDGNRGGLQDFYRDNTVCVWNGKQYTGTSQIGQLLGSLPKSKHYIETIDCQPSVNGNAINFLVIVNGFVEYEGNPVKRIFTQYILMNVGPDQKMYIASDTFRWVATTNKNIKPN